MSEKIFDKLIIGASFYAVGAACADCENTFIAESGGLVGGEFVNCFNEKEPNEHNFTHEITREFALELTKRNIIGHNGSIHLGPTMYVLCDLIRRHSVNMLLYSRVLSVVKSGNVFDVTLFNSQGYSHIFAKKVIDTTSEGYISHFGTSNVKKSLNAIVFPNADAPKHNGITYNPQSKLYTFAFDVAMGDDIIVARKSFYDFWLSRSGIFSCYGMTLLSNSFAYTYTKKIIANDNDGIIYISSASCDDLLDAFNDGVTEGGNL